MTEQAEAQHVFVRVPVDVRYVVRGYALGALSTLAHRALDQRMGYPVPVGETASQWWAELEHAPQVVWPEGASAPEVRPAVRWEPGTELPAPCWMVSLLLWTRSPVGVAPPVDSPVDDTSGG